MFRSLTSGQVRRVWNEEGSLYLSTLRMVFVKDPKTSGTGWFNFGPYWGGATGDSNFLAYDLPLSLIRTERFNQPIFGCNNIEGECLPLPGTDGCTHFKSFPSLLHRTTLCDQC
jgi:hypothetical protein